ncbi:CatB-related O-acetyltransferase [Flavobacterium sp. MDT1-60]|uniref:CatB-related O-acetyltransferase n=1 Tax=Flavobacterium sp. MDT1-60 TaxID=1979344 RepID=UPI00177E3780|nr:CatB-related O-acetyltransferase [Flavobacterium sp. MDT1-60]QOG03783.1 CatB-related O-acetyltransferase [Flavobacterium sp. MDT1-60]
MILITFVKRLLFDLVTKIRKRIKFSRVIAKNPTCRFSSSSDIVESAFGEYVVIFEDNKIFNSRIDSYSYVQVGSRIFNCEIGKFCSIATSVSIAPGMHNLDKVTTHPALIQKDTPLPKVFAKQASTSFEKVFIGNDVWIGERAIILDGVKIGNGSVIAAGAVVVKDVEAYSIVGGIPAKHIKYRFDEESIHILQKSEWWNYSENWFHSNSELMLDPYQFIKYLKND